MNIKSNLRLAGTLMLSLMFLVSCAPSAIVTDSNASDTPEEGEAAEIMVAASEDNIISIDDEGSTTIDAEILDTALSQIPSGELSQEEIDGLLFMREEEKLAHDVYLELYMIWGLPIFQNIAQSEQTHSEAVLTLINRYELEDPASTVVGEFTNAALQDLYDQLIAQGSQSLVEALKVGAAIEEIDILDLEENINTTTHPDIIMVYENLMKGSRNHLRSFVSTIEKQTNEEYSPQFLTSEVFEEIIGSQIESGGTGSSSSGRNKNNRQSSGA